MNWTTTFQLLSDHDACENGFHRLWTTWDGDDDIPILFIATYSPMDAMWAMRTTAMDRRKAWGILLDVAYEKMEEVAVPDKAYFLLRHLTGRCPTVLLNEFRKALDEEFVRGSASFLPTGFYRLCVDACKATLTEYDWNTLYDMALELRNMCREEGNNFVIDALERMV